MKKIIVILLSIFLALSFVGCTPDAPAPDPTPTPDPLPQKSEKDMLIERLAANYQYVTGKEPGSWFIQVDNSGRMMVAIYCAGGPEVGVIGDVAAIEPNKYQVRLDIPAFAGNDMDEPHDAYSVSYIITFIDDNNIVVQFPEGYVDGNMVMSADNGLPEEQLLAVLASHGTYREDFNCFSFSTDGMYTRWIDCSEYMESGKISDLIYDGFDRYHFTVDFPAKAATEEADATEAYSMQVSISIYDNYKSMSLDETVKENVAWFNVKAD